jgi:hypothetical protein
MSKRKIIAFDMDDTLCTRKGPPDDPIGKYHQCVPIQEMIDIANECFDQGHIVKVYTARGMAVFKGDHHQIYSNLYELTKKQLDDWGVRYHELIMGKLHYDILIDDKVTNVLDIKDTKDVLKRVA